MEAEIIAVGSEMLTPERVDTNSLFLTAQLNDLGIEVTAKHVIGDDRERLASAVRRALSMVRLVIVSGGLGPTEDDVTRDAMALALDRRQVLNPDILAGIEQRFRAMNRHMPGINRRQAMVMEGAHVLANERGTAPGQWIEDGDRIAILLPGPLASPALFHRLRFELWCCAFPGCRSRSWTRPSRRFTSVTKIRRQRYWRITATCRCICARAARANAGRKRCWPKSARRLSWRWAIASTPAMAIRSKS
jgi:molybdenum cofactor synthesis domain-containing protein